MQGVSSTHWLAGGGEMGALMRAKDWSATPLGDAEAWPQSLRSAVSILLPSKAQIALFWGPELITLYNDAYRPVFGAKHPHALGLPIRESWNELWRAGLKELFENVLHTGEAFWARDRPFFMERHGYPEETFFDVSYDPVRDESGAVGGVFCIVSETTGRILSERRLKVLRDLAAAPAEAHTVEQACALSVRVLGSNPADIPFALAYLFHPETAEPRLAAAAGVPESDLAGHDRAWPLGEERRIDGLHQLFAAVPAGPWPEPPSSAMLLPLLDRSQGRPLGALVLGISARLRFDDEYRGFFGLLAGQVAASLSNARASEEERRRAEALAELDRAKTAFFSNVSHEFRTPLTLMLGPLEELLQRNAALSHEDKDLLVVARRNGQRLLKLVNTLLDFARIEAGRAQASFEPTDLAALTSELASNFRSACERAGLRLTVDCPALAEPAYVDRDMWEKIVLNLLSNAFKFTFEGGIAVALRDAGDSLRLEVSDTGTGIPAQELPRLFERFHRIPGARGRSHEGTGIGLALVQELVRLHGGAISVESLEGVGSRFIVRLQKGCAHLPAERVQAARAVASTALRADVFVEEAARWLPGDRVPTGGRVLVVDDNADMRDYVKRLLGVRYKVETAHDGIAALAAARATAPDIVIADVMMPRLDGIGLLAALRADARLRTVPVILLSARAGEEARIEGLQHGADDYLVKPFSARELLARVESHLEVARVRRESEAALLAANRRKDEFLAMLAHELRNPLAAVSIAAEILARARVEDERARFAADVIVRQVEQLQRLVDDLLDVARMMHGKLSLDLRPVELGDIARQVVSTHAERTGATCTIAGDAAWALGDPARVRQVIDNLVDNAVKYGGRNITIRTTMDGRWAGITVSDDGRGIAPELLERVFEPFVQGEQSLARPEGGLGLGLALVDRLVRLHGGSLLAESGGPGKGASFTVRLPRAEAPPALAEPRAPQPSVVKRRVLLVEDEPDAREALRILLEMDGHEVSLAADGIEGLAMLENARPEVALIDVGMPGLDGYEVARRVRRIEGFPVKLVALTGYGREQDRAEAQAAGFDLHLTKPVSYDALRQALVSGK